MRKFHTVDEMIRFAFDSVIKQGKPGYNPVTESCTFRAPDGSKCAIGFLIPDSLVEKTIGWFSFGEEEIQSFYDGPTHYKDVKKELGLLMCCHDRAASAPPEHFVREFSERAFLEFPWLGTP